MNKDESPIKTTNVNLGTRNTSYDSPVRSLKPWIILICADFGFVAEKPRRITSASLNELFETNDVIISGTVEKGLPDEIAPFHLDYSISDIKDLSPSSLADRLPLLQRLKNVSDLLNAVSENKIPAQEGLGKIASMQLPSSIMQLLGGIGPLSSASVSGTMGNSTKIDSILSMVETEKPRQSTTADPPDFVAALTESAQRPFSRAELLKCINAVEELVSILCTTVADQPFFKAAASSWTALKTVCKKVGRERSFHIYVHSAPYDAALRHFDDALGGCAAETGVPDIVIWDYPVATDTASVEQFGYIGAHAERFKSVVAASLDYHDDLYTKLLDGEPVKPLFEQPSYIPLRRLQENPSSRCLSLCAPDAVMPRRGSVPDSKFSSCWLLALQWITSCLEKSAPFHLQNSSIMVLDGFLFPKIPAETVLDAYHSGVTLLRPNGVTTPRVLFGSSESPYGSLLFNLLVNRTARLAAEWIAGHDSSLSCEAAAPALEHFLLQQLKPYHILSSDEALSVKVEDQQSLQVTMQSTITIAGFPVQFQFSFNYRD